MKIDDAIKKIASTSTTDVKQRQAVNANAAKSGSLAKAPATSSTSTSSNASSVVNISTQLQSMMEQVSDVDSFDVKKVEEIKAAIASGQFQINPEKVADGLIRSVSELIQKPGR